MSIEYLNFGQVMPLVVNAFDGSTAIFPQVTLRDNADALIGTFDLAHIGGGVYRNSARTFPSTLLVTANYKVFSDAGHTTLDLDYQERIDVFLQASAVVTQGSLQIVERVQALLSQDKITGIIAQAKLRAQIKTVRLQAVCKQTKIIGIINQNKILGIVKECC